MKIFGLPVVEVSTREILHKARITELANNGRDRVEGGILFGEAIDTDNPEHVIAALEAILMTKIMPESKLKVAYKKR